MSLDGSELQVVNRFRTEIEKRLPEPEKQNGYLNSLVFREIVYSVLHQPLYDLVDSVLEKDWGRAHAWASTNNRYSIPDNGQGVDPSNLLSFICFSNYFDQTTNPRSEFHRLAHSVRLIRNKCYGHTLDLELTTVTLNIAPGIEETLSFGQIIVLLRTFLTEINNRRQNF